MRDALMQGADRVSAQRVRDHRARLGEMLREHLSDEADIAIKSHGVEVSLSDPAGALIRHPELRDVAFLMRSVR